MANIKSQVKRIETNRKAEARNRAVRTELKSAVKAVREASTKGDRQAAAEALKNANRKLDKAVSKGVLHKNQAANRKSAITKKVSSL
jgi:small subunit ribosomal protein S20